MKWRGRMLWYEKLQNRERERDWKGLNVWTQRMDEDDDRRWSVPGIKNHTTQLSSLSFSLTLSSFSLSLGTLCLLILSYSSLLFSSLTTCSFLFGHIPVSKKEEAKCIMVYVWIWTINDTLSSLSIHYFLFLSYSFSLPFYFPISLFPFPSLFFCPIAAMF